MRLTSFLAVLAIVTAVVTLAVIALSRHQKAGAGNVKLIGEMASVETRLAPEGTVVIRGELWRARSTDGSAISPHTRVRVVGFKDLLALVEVCD